MSKLEEWRKLADYSADPNPIDREWDFSKALFDACDEIEGQRMARESVRARAEKAEAQVTMLRDTLTWITTTYVCACPQEGPRCCPSSATHYAITKLLET